MANNNSQEAKYADIIQRKKVKFSENQQEIFDNVEVYHQHYRAYMAEDSGYPWDYSLVDPVVFSLMRGTLARLNPDNMKIRLEATKAAAIPYTEKNQGVINWELGEMQKTLVFYRFLFRGLLAGRSYMSSGWHYEQALKILTGVKGKSEREIIMRDIINRAKTDPYEKVRKRASELEQDFNLGKITQPSKRQAAP